MVRHYLDHCSQIFFWFATRIAIWEGGLAGDAKPKFWSNYLHCTSLTVIGHCAELATFWRFLLKQLPPKCTPACYPPNIFSHTGLLSKKLKKVGKWTAACYPPTQAFLTHWPAKQSKCLRCNGKWMLQTKITVFFEDQSPLLFLCQKENVIGICGNPSIETSPLGSKPGL